MGSPDAGLTPRDAALLALDAAGGTIEGRTALQKIMYFVAVALDTDLGHRAHYYGPYSRTVEYAMTETALADEVTETMERIPSYYSGQDIRKYTYELASAGTAEAEAMRKMHPEAAKKVKKTIDAVHEAVPDLDQSTLSMAAKIHFIVSRQDEPTPIADIPDLANQLGWRLSEPQVQRSVDLLQKLDLLTVGKN